MTQRNNDQHSHSSMAWNHWLPRQRPPWGGSFIYSSISGPTLEWFPSCVRFFFLPKIEAQQGYLVCSFQRVSLARISRMVGEHVNLFLLLGNGRRRGELTYFFSLFPWPHQEAFGILSPWPGIKLTPWTVKAQSLNYWTTREFPS